MRRLEKNLILTFFLFVMALVPRVAVAQPQTLNSEGENSIDFSKTISMDGYIIERENGWVNPDNIYAKLIKSDGIAGLYKAYPYYKSGEQQLFFVLRASQTDLSLESSPRGNLVREVSPGLGERYFFYVYTGISPNPLQIISVHLGSYQSPFVDGNWQLGCFKVWFKTPQGNTITKRIPIGSCAGTAQTDSNGAQWAEYNDRVHGLTPVLLLSNNAVPVSSSIEVIPLPTQGNENSMGAELPIVEIESVNGQNSSAAFSNSFGPVENFPANARAANITESEPLYAILDIPGNILPTKVDLFIDGNFAASASGLISEPLDFEQAVVRWGLGGNKWQVRVIPWHPDFAQNRLLSETEVTFNLEFGTGNTGSIDVVLRPNIYSSEDTDSTFGAEQPEDTGLQEEGSLQSMPENPNLKTSLWFRNALELNSLRYAGGNQAGINFELGKCEGTPEIDDNNQKFEAVCISAEPFESLIVLEATFRFDNEETGRSVDKMHFSLTHEEFEDGHFQLNPQVNAPLATLGLEFNLTDINAVNVQDNLAVSLQGSDSESIFINYISEGSLSILYRGDLGVLEGLDTFGLELSRKAGAGFNLTVKENQWIYSVEQNVDVFEVGFELNVHPNIQISIDPQTVKLPLVWQNVAQLPSNQNQDPNLYCSIGLKFSSNSEPIWLKRDGKQFVLDIVPNEITPGARDLPSGTKIELVVRPNPDISEDYIDDSLLACAQAGTVVRELSAETLANLDALEVPFARPVFVYFLRSRTSDGLFLGSNLDVYGSLMQFFGDLNGKRLIEFLVPSRRGFDLKNETNQLAPLGPRDFENLVDGPATSTGGPSVEKIFDDIEQRKVAYGLTDSLWPDIIIVSFGSITGLCENFIRGIPSDMPGSRLLVVNHQKDGRIVDGSVRDADDNAPLVYWESETCEALSVLGSEYSARDYQVTLAQTDISYLLSQIEGKFDFEKMSQGTPLLAVLDGFLSPSPF